MTDGSPFIGSRPSGFNRIGKSIAWAIAGVLLFLALRQVEVEEVLRGLQSLSLEQLGILFLVNTAVVLLLSGRWWAIMWGMGYRIPYGFVSVYRLCAFAWSYFTPGPQFGGEPIQVLLVQRRHGIPGTTATSAVMLDKAIELLGNFTFLALGSLIVIQLELFDGMGKLASVLAIGLLLIPVLFLLAAGMGFGLGGWIFTRLPGWLFRRFPAGHTMKEWIDRVDEEIIKVCQDRFGSLLLALIFSLLSWMALIFEYRLMLGFLSIQLDSLHVIALLTITRFAFLTPMPGGLGALEAAQVFALSSFGYNPDDGLRVALIVRGRDLLFGLIGLAVGGILLRERVKSHP